MPAAIARRLHYPRCPGRPRASIRVGLVTLLLIGLPRAVASQPPTMASPVLVPGDATVSLAASDQTHAAVARGGAGSLVVWTDLRSAASSYDIYAARLDASGQLLDPSPMAVLLDASGQTRPHAVWNGTNWIVVALDDANPVGSGQRLRAVRVSPAGQVLDPTPIVITSAASSTFTVASDGSGWAVFWSGTSAGSAGIRATRVSATGSVLDPGGRLIVPESYFVRSVMSVAFAGGSYLLAYNESSSIAGQRLTPALDPAGGAFTIFATNQATRLAASGTGFLAVAARAGWYIYFDIIAARISATGQVLDNPPRVINSEATWGADPDAVFDGQNWVVGWSQPGLRAARVSTAGVVLDAGGVALDASHASSHATPRLAPLSGGGAVLTWADDRSDFLDVYTLTVDAAMQEGASAGISLAAPRQEVPGLASGAGVTMLAYRSTVAGAARIKATLLDAQGNFLLPEPIEVASTSETFANAPAVAFDGTRFLVAWSPGAPGENRIYGRRYLPDGTALDPAPVFIMDAVEPHAAGLNGTFLVAGTRGSTGYPARRYCYAVRVSGTDGAVLGAPALLDPGYGDTWAIRPRVASFGNRWLVVWQGRWSHDNPWSRIRGNFVAADGTAGTSFVVADGQNYNYLPAAAASQDVALVTFESSWNGSCCWDLYGARFDVNGTRLDPYGGAVLVAADDRQGNSSVAWTGSEFLVAFEDRRDAAVTGDTRPDIYGVRVGSDGVVLDPGGFEIAGDALPEITPAVHPMPAPGSAVVVYPILEPAAPFVAERLALRFTGMPLVSSAVGGLPDARGFVLLPNPSTGVVQLAGPAATMHEGPWGIYDAQGRLRAVFGGRSWDGRDAAGRALPSGVYYARPVGSRTAQALKLIRQ